MYNRNIHIIVIYFFICSGIFCVSASDTEAGVFSRSVAKVAARKAAARKAIQKTIQKKSAKQAASKKAPYKKIYAHDLNRDNSTLAKPLEKTRIVRRYTSAANAKRIKADGLPPKTHMTAIIPQGRPISAAKAQRRYGIKDTPDARLTIRIPKGHPVKKNKVIGGEPGWGEITSPKHIPSKNIVKMDNIR